ncbi:MAG: tetratricopeptide repeat protein [Nitrospirota bacterium]
MAVDRSTLIQNAQRFMARGQIDKAIEEWQKLVSLTPQDGNLYNTIGDLYLKKNDTHHAVETFMLAATAFERAGFALKTIAVYKKVLKIDPSHLEVNLKLADLNAERGLTGNAIEDYLKVAKEYGRRGKVQEALEIYRKIANFDPNNTNIRLKLAELSLKEKLTDEAIDEYMKVAKNYEQNGRAGDAAALYKKILEINPKHAGAKEALKAGVTPATVETMPTVAEIEQAIGAEEWEMAKRKVGVLLLHEPTNAQLRRLRGVILLHNGEAGLAWADFRGLAEEAARSGRLEDAIGLVRDFLGQAPKQTEAAEMAAKLLDQAGRTEEALHAYAALIDAMAEAGSDAADILEHVKRMKELNPAGEVTRRYQARFEPDVDEPLSEPAQTAVGPDPIAEEMLEPSISVFSDTAVEPSISMHRDAVEESAPPPLAVNPSEQAFRAGAHDEPPAEQPAVREELIEEPAPAPEPTAVEAAARLEPIPLDPEPPADVEPSVKPAPKAPPERSVSLPRQANLSQSRGRKAPPAPKEPSVSGAPGASVSRSRSGGTGAAPQSTPGAKRPRSRDLPDYFAEAEVYLKYGLASKAIEQFQMILSVDANNIEAHGRLRELYQLEGRIDEAVTHSVLLARLFFARGQREQAEQVLSEAREWNPADPRLHAALEEQSSIGPASVGAMPESAETTLARPKQDLQEWLAEAEFYLQQGLDEQAHQLFTIIRQHYPQAPEVVAYFENHQDPPLAVNPSEQAFRAGARGEPSKAKPAGAPLAEGLDDLGDPLNQSDAPEENDRSLSRKLADLFPGAFRGVAEESGGANDRLAASVEGVIRAMEQGGQPLSPDGPDPHYSLGLAYKEMGLHAEARKEFEQAMQAPVYRVDAALMAAACHQAEGHPRQALQQLQECAGWLDEQDPKWRAVVCELAALHAEVGDLDSAAAQARRVLAVQADYEPAVALLKRVTEPPKDEPRAPDKPISQPPNAEPRPAAARMGKDKRSRISYV